MAKVEGLSRKELEAFRKGCAANGANADDFALEVQGGELTSDSVPARIVVVRRGKVFSCYQGSFGSDWIGQFVEDVRAHRWL